MVYLDNFKMIISNQLFFFLFFSKMMSNSVPVSCPFRKIKQLGKYSGHSYKNKPHFFFVMKWSLLEVLAFGGLKEKVGLKKYLI